MLQKNPVLARMGKAVVKRVLGELEKKAKKAPDEYAAFWSNFGPVLKEGIYEDEEQRERLLKLARFRSTAADGLVSFDDYAGRMREGQEAIYYITGEDVDSLAKSPQLEGFAARGVEVLLFADAVDAFWTSAVASYDDKPLRPANRGGADLDKIAPLAEEGEEKKQEESVEEAELVTLVTLLKQTLGEQVQDVRASERLTESAVCLVADDTAMDPHLERLLRQQNQLAIASPRILEINPRHGLIKALATEAQKKGAVDALDDAAHLLLDQARIADGEQVVDPADFARRLSEIMTKGIGG
jgi:molecular chaperone HtpG